MASIWHEANFVAMPRVLQSREPVTTVDFDATAQFVTGNGFVDQQGPPE